MGFVDFVVDRCFRDEDAGRVVVFNGIGRGRGYLVGSPGEELKIRAFLKMFYYADFSIQMLGTLLVCGWIGALFGTGKPTLERELARGGLFLASYVLIVGLPFFFLWRSFKRTALNFVSPERAVALSPRPMDRARMIAVAALALLAVLLLAAVVMLVRAR